jgi:putative hydroxymethylpyrimidine transport system substrate-binding protein
MRQITAMLIAVAALLSGCGSSTSSAPSAHAATTNASLVLDFTPNAVHAGIYTAIARGYDRADGVRLHVIVPSASTDSIKLLKTGQVNFAILDIHDLAIARERGADIVGIMAIVQRPLAAVIAAPSVGSPRALAGKAVGITGVPSDTAVLDSVVTGAGGDPHRVRTVTIGFNAVAALLSGRVAAATAFWNDEGVTLARRRPGFHSFRVEDYGAPAYPELVLCATGATIARDPGLARVVADSLARGYDAVLADPRAGATALETRVPGLDPTLVRAQLAALLPAFRGPGGRVGVLDLARLKAWARWEARFGIVSRVPDISATFDPSVLGG